MIKRLMAEPNLKAEGREAAGGGNPPGEGAPTDAMPVEQKDDGLSRRLPRRRRQCRSSWRDRAAECGGWRGGAGAAPPSRAIHCVRRVSIAFDELVVLEDVSFSILPGETLCILGRSGVGSRVALKIVMDS